MTPLLFAVDIQKLQEEQNQFVKKYQEDIAKDAQRYQRDIVDDTTTYITKALYETNYQARQLLDNARFAKNPYPLVKEAFDIHSRMQNGMFAIFDNGQKLAYINEHKKYINALFHSTTTPQDIQETFNRWINYKRTLFDDENGFFHYEKNRAIYGFRDGRESLGVVDILTETKRLQILTTLKEDLSFEVSDILTIDGRLIQADSGEILYVF